MNEIWEKREQQLIEALKKAAKDLLAHQNIRPAQITITLDARMSVTIGPSIHEAPSEQDPAQPGQVPEES